MRAPILPIIILFTIALTGCSTIQAAQKRQQTKVAHSQKVEKIQDRLPAPVIVPPAVAPEPSKPLTFRERFRETFGKIRWLHER